MGQEYKYVARITGDTSELEKVINKARGKLQRLNDDEVLIKLDYDGNVSAFNKTFNKMLKAAPELTIQFQYDVNKKILNQEMEKLQQLTNLKMSIDEGTAGKNIQNMVESLKKAYDDMADETALYSRLKEIVQYANTLEDLGVNLDKSFLVDLEAIAEEYESLDDLLQQNAEKPIKLFKLDKSLDDTIAETQERVDSFQTTLEKLKKKGASELSDTTEFKELSDQVKILTADIEEMKSQISNLSGEQFDEMRRSVNELEESLAAALKRIQELSEAKVNPNNISFHVGDLGSNKNRWKSESMNHIIPNMNMGDFDTGDYGYGILGTGVYHSTWAEDLSFSSANPKGYALNIDPSKYKLLVARLDEEAEKLMSFLGQMQGYVIAQGSGYDGWDDVLKGVDTDSLYKKYVNAFGETAMDIKEFSDFVDSMIAQVAEIAKLGMSEDGSFNTAGTKWDHADTPITQLLKKMGYEGIDLRGTKYDSYEQGSTIFDLHPEDIIKVFDTQEEMESYWKNNKDAIKDFNEAASKSLGEAGERIEKLTKYVEELNNKLLLLEATVERLSGLGAVQDAASDVSAAAVEGIKNGQHSHSPSVDGENQADNLIEGYLGTLEDNVGRAEATGEKLSEAVVSGLAEGNIAEATAAQEKYELALVETNDELKRMAELAFRADTTNAIDSYANQTQILKAQAIEEERLANEAAQRAAEIEKQNQRLEEQRRIIAGAAETAFKMDTGRTGANQLMQGLQESYRLTQQQVDETVRLTQAQMEETAIQIRQRELANQFGDAIKEYADDISRAEGNAEELAESLKKAISVTKNAEAGSSLDLLSDLQSQIQYSEKARGTIDKLIKDVSKLNDSDKYIDSFIESVLDLQSRLEELSTQDIISPEQLENIQKAINALKDASKLDVNKTFKELSRSKYLDQISQYLTKYTGLSAETRAELEKITEAMRKANSSGELKELYDQFVKLKTSARNAGEEVQSMFTNISHRLNDMNAKFIAQFLSWQDILRYIRQVADNVIGIDTALTELRKVSDASNTRLQQSFEASSKSAQELGSTISDVINITSDWARLGYNVDQAEELARITTLFKTVGDNMSADDASSYLVSTLQGFQLGVDKAEQIVDKYNQVANNFAIDTAGIGEALQRSAASFYASNTDLSKAIALITATNEVVQNPESVGTLWKTLSARIRGATTELKDLGEEEDEFTKTTSKLRDLVKSLTGFDIMKDENTFKDIYEIILGIGKEWDKLTDVERASLGEALAGKRNANALYAVLGNLDTLQKAYAEAEDSAGSAAREQENYAQSVQYSIDRFKASIEEISYDFMNSQLLKDGIEFGNSFIQILDKIIEKIGGLEAAIGLVTIALGVKFRKEIKKTATELSTQLIKKLAEVGTEAQLAGAASTEMSAEMAGFIALGPQIAAIAGAIAVVTAAIIIGAKAWDDYQTTVKEWNKKIEETTEKIKELQSEIKNLQDIDYRTQDEQNRLDALQKELDYQQQLLQIEEKRAAIQKYGYNSFAQSWDKDNANNVLADDREERRHPGLATVHDASLMTMGFDAAVVMQAAIDIEEYDKQLKNLDKDSDEYAKTLEKRESAELNSADSLDKLITSTADYNKKLEEAQEAQKLFKEGSDEWLNAENIIQTYSSWIAENESAIERYQKVLGTFDYSSIISSMLSHAEFDGVKEELVKLAQEGSLSVDYLSTHFGKLVEKLDENGASAEELYQWILRISGLVDRENLAKKISDSLGKQTYDDRGFALSDTSHIISEYLASLSEEEAKIVAGLDIDWSTFDAQEAIEKMQAEIDKAGPLEAEVKVDEKSFTQSISDLNDLENALNNVGTAMANIDENGKFQLGDLDTIADYFLGLESAEEKVEYETDAVANALKLLGEGTGDIEQNANAINVLADNYLRTSGILEGLTETNKELYITRLQMMGIINAEAIVEEQLAAATADVVNQKTVEAVTDAQLVAVKEALVASDANMVNASVEVIKAILDEGNASNATRAAVFDLVAQQTVFSNQNLNVNQKIEALETLANAFLDTASAAKYASEMAQVEAKANSLKAAIDSHGYDDATITKKRNEINSEIAQITRKYSSDAAKTQVKFTRAQYNGGTPVSSKLGYTPTSTADALKGTQAKAIEDSAKKASDAAKDAEDSFEQLYDYFERMIKVLDNSINLLEAHLEDVVGSFAKNTLLSAEEDLIQSKMNGYASAISMYSQKASEALSKIPTEVAEKLQNGAVAIDEFVGEGNEEVYEAIQDYEKWADKVADCKLQIVELREAIRQLELKKFQNVMKDFTDQFDLRQSAGIDLISKQIDLLKEAGQLVGESFYTKQIEQANKQLDILNREQEALVKQLNEALSKGIDTGSDEWLEMVNSLTDVEGSILDCKKAIEEFDNAILELHTEIFNRIQDQFASFKNELSNMQELFNDEALPVATKDNKWTNEGLAQLGLLSQQYELASYQVEQYNQEIETLTQNYLAGRYSATEYADRLIELKSAQWDAVNASEAAIDAMRDLNETRVNIVIDGINEEIDAYSELISKQKELLSAEKDLYEYQKSIAESEKDITKLQRQLAAIADDDSQAARAKRAQLEEELAEAQDALEEKQYDHSIEMQQTSLDEQLEQYKATRQLEIEALQESLLNVEQILAETFEAVRENSQLIGQEIVIMAQEHSIEMSTALTDAWFQGENAIAQYGQVLSAESSAFIGNIQGVEYQVYQLQEQANQTAVGLADMFSTRADNLVQQLTDSYMSEGNLNNMTNALHDSLSNTIDGAYSGSGAKAALDSIAEAANGVATAADNARAALEAMGAAQAAAQNVPSYTGKIYQQGSDGDYYYAGEGTVSGNNIWEKNGRIYVDNGYASGIKKVTENQLAWTQEKGAEAIISPTSGAILTPLRKGDMVLPADQTENIWGWSRFNPDEYAAKLAQSIGSISGGDVQTNTMQIGSLVTVNGNVNDAMEMMQIAATTATAKIKQSFKELSNGLNG